MAINGHSCRVGGIGGAAAAGGEAFEVGRHCQNAGLVVLAGCSGDGGEGAVICRRVPLIRVAAAAAAAAGGGGDDLGGNCVVVDGLGGVADSTAVQCDRDTGDGDGLCGSGADGRNNCRATADIIVLDGHAGGGFGCDGSAGAAPVGSRSGRAV